MSQSEYLRRMLSNNAVILSRNKVRDSSEHTFIANARASSIVPKPVATQTINGCVGYANSKLNGTGGEYLGNLQVKIGCAVCSDSDSVVNNYLVTPCIVEDHTKYPWVQKQTYSVFVPEAPYNITGTTGNGQVTLSWLGPQSDGGSPIKSYVIIYRPGDVTVTSNTTSVTISGLQNGTTYTFKVYAVNNFAQSVAPLTSTGLVPSTVPSAPTALSATTTLAATTATIAFTPGSDGGSPITNYKYSYSYTSDGTTYNSFSAYANVSPTQINSPITISGLINPYVYRFYLEAVNANGASAPSATYTSVSLYKSGSFTFAGNPAQYLTISSSSALNMSTGDFTIEGFVNVTNFTVGNWSSGAGGFAEVIQINNGTGFLAVELTQTAGWRFRYNVSAASGVNSPQSSATSIITAGTWYHFALVRFGNSLILYVNGASVCSTTLQTSDSLGFASATLSIGATAGGLNTGPFSISNIRTVIGRAIYTATFTAPTQNLTAISGTSLLLNTFYSVDTATKAIVDGSTNNATIVVNGSPSPSSSAPF